MTDVFVSYARQDRDRIAPLVRALEARGLEVWWDSRIAGGAEVPLFNLLGVPDEEKRLARFDGGHMPSDMNAVIREALAWLDRWLGPVEPQRRSAGG